MRKRPWLVRWSGALITVAYLAMFINYFFPGNWGWQVACQCSLSPEAMDLPILLPGMLISGFLTLALLVVPPLSAWLVARYPTSLVGLIGLWISLPLILLYLSYFGIVMLEISFYPRADLLLYVTPALVLILSFVFCLMLALILPRHWTTRLSASERERAGLGDEGRSEHIDAAERGRTGLSLLQALLLLLALLAHVLIFVSLAFPYLVYGDSYSLQPETTSTGWQLLAQAFLPRPGNRSFLMPAPSAPLVVLLLAVLILPMFFYLVSLVLVPFKRTLGDTLLRRSIYTAYVLAVSGLVLSSACLVIALLFHGGDAHDPYQITQRAFDIPPLAFLFTLLCCGILLSLSRRFPAREPA